MPASKTVSTPRICTWFRAISPSLFTWLLDDIQRFRETSIAIRKNVCKPTIVFTGCWVVCILTLGVLAPASLTTLWGIGLFILGPSLIGFAGVVRSISSIGNTRMMVEKDRPTRQSAGQTQRPVGTISVAHPYVKPIAIQHDTLSPARRADCPHQRTSEHFGDSGYRQTWKDWQSYRHRRYLVSLRFYASLGATDDHWQDRASSRAPTEIRAGAEHKIRSSTSPSDEQVTENHNGARPFSIQPSSQSNQRDWRDAGDDGKRSSCGENRHRTILHDSNLSGERPYKGNRVTLLQVLAHALWVVGLAGFLATFSFAGWQRRNDGLSTRVASPLFIPTACSLLAVCTGALLNGFLHPHTTPWWEQVAWGLLVFILILLLAADQRSRKGNNSWGKTRLGFIDGGEDL